MRGKKYILIVSENAVNTAIGVNVREMGEWLGMEDWEEEREIRRWVKESSWKYFQILYKINKTKKPTKTKHLLNESNCEVNES